MTKKLAWMFVGIIALIASPRVDAELVRYEFLFEITSGTLNGSDVSGQTVIAIGAIANEIDLLVETDRGSFAATTDYFLSGGGSVTGVADFLFQFQSGATSQYGLLGVATSLNNAIRFQDNSGLSPMTDPNIPEATGAFRYDDFGPFGQPRTIIGTGGTLVISDADYDPIGGINVQMNPIPEPASAGVLAFAGLGLLTRRRRR